MKNRKYSVYEATIKSQFKLLKEINLLETLHSASINLPVSKGMLIPVCKLMEDDDKIITELAEWRQKFSFAYPSRFKITLEGTRTWLKDKLLKLDDRILFLVIDRHGNRIGHIGFANCLNDKFAMEIDNVVRGVSNTSSGIMSESLKVLIKWANCNFWPEQIFLRVLSDNSKAILFYERNSFKSVEVQPLRLHRNNNVESLKPREPHDISSADNSFVVMVYEPASTEIGTDIILTAGPSISAREIIYTNDAVRYGWNNQWANYLKEFEKSFADYIGVKYAIATSSCTGALHIALMALGIGPGDEVIVPDITWVASANAVLYVGAIPVFADVELESWCLDPYSFESLITSRTKAVIPVHLYGHPAKMDEIISIAERYNIRVVEDAAPSIGAQYKGQRTGSFGDFSAFSFQGAKLAVTGEGGMLLTDNRQLYETAYSIWDQGRKPGTLLIQSNGLKYKMANVVAAIGLAQLERNDGMVEAKRRIFQWYYDELKDCSHILINKETIYSHSIYWMTSILVRDTAPLNRDKLIQELKKKNIDTRPVFPSISQYPIWPKVQASQPTANYIGNHGINLPSGVCLSKLDILYITKNIKELLFTS